MSGKRRYLLVCFFAMLGAMITSACGAQEAPAPTSTGPGQAASTQPGQVVAGQPVRGGTLTTWVDSTKTLDWMQEQFRYALYVGGGVSVALVTYDPQDAMDTKIVGELAERWEVSNDSKTVTFFLRKGGKWEDGTPVTAEDAKFSFQRYADPPPGILKLRNQFFFNIDRYEVKDPYTLILHLKQPQTSLLAMLASGFNAIAPKHILEKDPRAIEQRVVNGAGPFKVTEVNMNVNYKLARNPDYILADKIYVDKVEYVTIVDPFARVAAFRAGRLDYLHGAPAGEVESLKKDMPQVTIQQFPGLTFSHFQMNQTKRPFDNLKVRQALALSIDRDALIQGPGLGFTTMTGGMPATGKWNIPEAELRKLPGYRKPKDQDIARARELLKEAGYPDGFSFKILANTASPETALVLADQFKAIGLTAQIDPVEFTLYQNRIFRSDFETCPCGFGFNVDDPDDILAGIFRTGGARNNGKYSNPALDKLIDEQTAVLEPEKRKKAVIELQYKLLEDAGAIPTIYGANFTAVQPWLKNFTFHTSLFNGYWKYWNTWIDPTLKPKT